MKCPECGLDQHYKAKQCRCGYEFEAWKLGYYSDGTGPTGSESAAVSKNGVWFHRPDYLGFWKRTIVATIDILVVLIVFAVVLIPAPDIAEDSEYAVGLFEPLIFGFICAVYYIVLKRSRVGTVGYRLFGVQIVDLHGERPSLFRMISRFSFILLGPLNGIIDLLWIPSDDQRQAFRDKWSRTYVVKRDAHPAGSGRIITRRYNVMGFNLVFEEVEGCEATAE